MRPEAFAPANFDPTHKARHWAGKSQCDLGEREAAVESYQERSISRRLQMPIGLATCSAITVNQPGNRSLPQSAVN